MKFKKIILTSSLILLVASCSGSQKKGTSFSFASVTGDDDYPATVYYTDDYFKEDSTVFNSSLATSSLCLALASFSTNKDKSTFIDGYRNANQFLSSNGFEGIDVNQYFKTKPSKDSLGVIFGHKKIDGKTLIAVGIRGANYKMEWASNLTVGDGKTVKQHQGFYEASTIYLDSLKEYITNQKITGELKIWTVGYSRAAAANNLACGRMDQRINAKEKLFDGLDVSLKKEDLYSYCFEAPQGASFNEDISPRDQMYSNIHNIINSNDPVPMVAMSVFRFTRYGVDYYLPDSVRNSNYDEFKPKMVGFYNNLSNRSKLADYSISDFDMRRGKDEALNALERSNVRKNWTLGLFLQEFINALSTEGVVDLDNYTKNIQPGLRNVVETVFLSGGFKFSLMNVGIYMARALINDSNVDIAINNLLHNRSAFLEDFLYSLKKAFTSLSVDIDAKQLVEDLMNFAMALVTTFALNIEYFFALISTDNIKTIPMAHYPEVCFSHLMALDENYNSNAKKYHNDGSYYYLEVPSISSETKITITNENGKTVAGLDSGSVLKNSALTCGSKNKTFICYIPVDAKFKIHIEKADSYKLSYFDQRYENLVEYKNESVSSNGLDLETVTYPEKK